MLKLYGDITFERGDVSAKSLAFPASGWAVIILGDNR